MSFPTWDAFGHATLMSEFLADRRRWLEWRFGRSGSVPVGPGDLKIHRKPWGFPVFPIKYREGVGKAMKSHENHFFWWGKDRPSFLVGEKPCTFSDLSHPMWPWASQGLNEGGRVLCAQPSAILVGSQAPRGCHLSKSLLEVSRTQWCGRSFRLHNFQVNVRQFSTITQSCLQTEHSYTFFHP